MRHFALVVDDSMLIRHSVCRYFEDRGFAVESATNGQEALEILETVLPDVIITDLQMPKLDGHELIKALKSKPETSRIPVVVLSGRKSGSESITRTQADYVIFKDIDIESQLEQVLKSALPGRHGDSSKH